MMAGITLPAETRPLASENALKSHLDSYGRRTFNFVVSFKPTDFNFVNVKNQPRNPFHRTGDDRDVDDTSSWENSERPLPDKSKSCTLVDAVIKQDAALLRKLLSQDGITKAGQAHHELTLLQCNGSKRRWEPNYIDEASPRNLQHEKAVADLQLNSAITVAISGRSPEMLEILLESGWDPKSFSYGFPVTHSAIYTKDIRLVDVLLKHGATFDGCSATGTALHCAAVAGSAEILQRILPLGLDIDARNRNNCTPLHLAVDLQQTECVKLLIENGCDIHAKDSENGQTPLHYAAVRGSYGIAKALLERGAHLMSEDNKGLTPWMLAAMHNKGMLMTLLQHEWDVNQAIDEDGHTLLHMACEKGAELCARLLLLSGACPNVQDSNGRTPLMAAILSHKTYLVKLLTKVAHCDVSILDSEGNTALQIALNECSPTLHPVKTIAKLLVAAGADINGQYSCGRTPLMKHASHKGKIELLVQLGANPNVVTEDGRTVLWEVANKGCFFTTNILTTLFEKTRMDSRLAAICAEGTTPLQQCLLRQSAEAAACLLNYDCSLGNMPSWLKPDTVRTFAHENNTMERVVELVKERCRQPRPLLDSSRLAVLASLKPGDLKPQVEKLQLPPCLKAYMDWQDYQVWKGFHQGTNE